MTGPTYLVVDRGKVRHIQRPVISSDAFCGVRGTPWLMGTEYRLPVCKRCQAAWDKAVTQ